MRRKRLLIIVVFLLFTAGVGSWLLIFESRNKPESKKIVCQATIDEAKRLNLAKNYDDSLDLLSKSSDCVEIEAGDPMLFRSYRGEMAKGAFLIGKRDEAKAAAQTVIDNAQQNPIKPGQDSSPSSADLIVDMYRIRDGYYKHNTGDEE